MRDFDKLVPHILKFEIVSNKYVSAQFIFTDKLGTGLSWSVNETEILIGRFPPDIMIKSSGLGIAPDSPSLSLNLNVWP